MNKTLTKITRTSGLLQAAMAALLFCVLPARAAEEKGTPPAIELGAPFCDHAVLQRDMKVPVWGWSKPGDTITVEFAGQKKTVKAGDDGKFMVWLDPMKASFEPRTMTITSATIKPSNHQPLTIANVLVGEVWLASGQSNMQWKALKCNVLALAQRLAVETEGKPAPIREFEVTSVTAQLHPIERATGAWQNGTYDTYSAIAFAFAEKLYRELNVPIGILNCSWSSTQIEAWVPREGWAAADDEYSKAIHLKCLQTDPATPEYKEAWGAFFASMEAQIAEGDALIKQGKEATAIGAPLPGNMSSNRDASWLYNGRLSPVVPYAIRGAIWNQGWHNRNGGLTYYNNLHSLIRGWRIVWDKPELPVYFHQFYCPDKTDKPGIDSTAEMRLATWMARDIPHADMASQIDIGGAIHYREKVVPGRRLALHALKNQYPSTELQAGGKAADLVANGPMYKSYTVKGDKVTIAFDHADGGLVVGDTAFNRAGSRANPEATGFADPKIIENGEEKVKLFWLAGEDRVWHPATFEIKGDQVIVQSAAVKQPHGVSYGSGGIGFQPCLYNQALLPLTPFIVYDNEMVTTKTWPDRELRIAGTESAAETVADAETVDLLEKFRKMPLLSVQFRDDAVFQADKPVTIWGSTRSYGEWQNAPEEGDCKVHVAFGPQSGKPTIEKVIDVTPEMTEWQLTVPPMKAGPEPYALKVGFTVDGQLVHERSATNIVFGDVWYVAAPAVARGATWTMPEVKPSGQIVRMLENESNRDRKDAPSRFSVCVSRTPQFREANGKWSNRYASYWKEASGLAAAIGETVAARSKRPVGIVLMQSKEAAQLKNWIYWEFLKDAPSLIKDYSIIGSRFPANPHYVENARRYLGEWRDYWNTYMPAMIATRAVPDGAQWGWMPSIEATTDSEATFTYNVFVHCFTPMQLSGIIFLAGPGMVADDGGANFGSEMSVLANCLKSRFALRSSSGQDAGDVPFICTVPDKTLAPKITQPKKNEGKGTAVTVSDWLDVSGVIDAVAK